MFLQDGVDFVAAEREPVRGLGEVEEDPGDGYGTVCEAGEEGSDYELRG